MSGPPSCVPGKWHTDPPRAWKYANFPRACPVAHVGVLGTLVDVTQSEGSVRVLVVEDEVSIATLMSRALDDGGYDVRHCDTAGRALHLLRTWLPEVVLLDLSLPDADGIDLERQIRSFSDVPLLIVSGRAAEDERLLGLRLGADDYIVKPFSMPELLLRIEAVLRRDRRAQAAERLAHGPIVMDLAERRVIVSGDELDLSNKEFELLRVLLERPGKVVRRNELASSVWGSTSDEIGKTLDVHVSWLRQKLGDSAQTPRYIETVRGVGFRLRESD